MRELSIDSEFVSLIPILSKDVGGVNKSTILAWFNRQRTSKRRNRI